MIDVVIVCGLRTPIGKFNGALKRVSATQLGSVVISEIVRRYGVEDEIEEVIMGDVVSAGLGQNPARQAMLGAGLSERIPAFTINKVCGSSLKAVMLAAQAIKAGDFEVVLAGGMESMTQAPFLLKKARSGYKLGNGILIDALVYDGLWDVYNDFHMGVTGEIVAEKYGISRLEQDRLSLESHQKALKAQKNGKFGAEIVPVELSDEKVFKKDEGPREDTSLEKLQALSPVFKRGGTITAGNASQISDGAAALLVMTKDKAQELGLKPLARIISYNSFGVKPEFVMEAPIPSVKALLEKNQLEVNDIDLLEHNEAFAAASCAVRQELKVPKERFNVNGGAVALGHPIGASGARVLVTLIHALRDREKRGGVATLCLGGGNAVSMLVERI
ncbi:MAG: acetyl-CoA C-acetyltransferase [Candidatus Methanofastidiosia archaeon]